MQAVGAAIAHFGSIEALQLRESIVDLRTNDVVDYAIVLPAGDFEPWLWMPSRATTLRVRIPGLLVLTDNDVRSNVVIFEQPPRHNVLYLKLPKEGLYVEAAVFQDKVVRSELSEFISVLARLGAQSITVRTRNQAATAQSVRAALSASGVDVGANGETMVAHDGAEQWTQRFADTQVIHAETFANPAHYFYLPKHPDWVDLITNRLQYSGLEARYTYRHTNRSYASASLMATLNSCGVECRFTSSALETVELEYEIVYFPLEEKTKSFFW